MVKSTRRHTRLAIRDLDTANATFDSAANDTELKLTFTNGESVGLVLEGDESVYLGKIGEWLMKYHDMEHIGDANV